MRAGQVVRILKQKYPGKKIFKNNEKKPTEIICEIEPTEEHEDYSVAIAVIDRSIPHYHQQTKEVYEVMEGELDLFVNGKRIKLKKGEDYTIEPGMKHYAVGQETWIKTTSQPGWRQEDYLRL